MGMPIRAGRRPVALVLAATIATILGSDARAMMPEAALWHGGATTATVASAVVEAVRDDGRADVIVLLHDGVPDDASDGNLILAADAAQDAVLRSMPPGGFELGWRYEMFPMLSGTVTAEGLAALRDSPHVSAVELQQWMRPVGLEMPTRTRRAGQPLAEAVPSVGADYVHSQLGITGKGVTVAVLDTGIDNEHPDFTGRILDQYCFSSSRSCAPSNIVEGPNAQDEGGHGTAVTGIIASKGAVSPIGVAPDAGIVAVRVFKDEGGASDADIIKGLDWVGLRQRTLNIRVVNMSLGGGAGRGNNCDDQNVNMKRAFQRLVARNIVIMVATGNDGYPAEVSSPGCISNAVAVGATYDTEAANGAGWCPQQTNVNPLTIACFTNRGRAMDLLAPGLFIRSSKLNGGVTAPGAGTSYASPMAAGVAALLLQADASLRPNEILNILQDTGRDVKHLENSDVFKLVDAKAAVMSVLPATFTPPPPTATHTAMPTQVSSATPTVHATGPTPTPADPATVGPPTETPGSPATYTPETPTTPDPSATDPHPSSPIYLPVSKNLVR